MLYLIIGALLGIFPSFTATLCPRQGVYWNGPCSRGILFVGQTVWSWGELYTTSLARLFIVAVRLLI